MNKQKPNPEPADTRRVDVPIIDFLCYEPELKALVAEFVPEPVFSDERKESVHLYDGTSGARRAQELLAELAVVCGITGSIAKLAHGGGESFSLYADDGSVLDLDSAASSPLQTLDAYAILQTLSQEIQLEFLRQRRTGQRQAV